MFEFSKTILCCGSTIWLKIMDCIVDIFVVKKFWMSNCLFVQSYHWQWKVFSAEREESFRNVWGYLKNVSWLRHIETQLFDLNFGKHLLVKIFDCQIVIWWAAIAPKTKGILQRKFFFKSCLNSLKSFFVSAIRYWSIWLKFWIKLLPYLLVKVFDCQIVIWRIVIAPKTKGIWQRNNFFKSCLNSL